MGAGITKFRLSLAIALAFAGVTSDAFHRLIVMLGPLLTGRTSDGRDETWWGFSVFLVFVVSLTAIYRISRRHGVDMLSLIITLVGVTLGFNRIGVYGVSFAVYTWLVIGIVILPIFVFHAPKPAPESEMSDATVSRALIAALFLVTMAAVVALLLGAVANALAAELIVKPAGVANVLRCDLANGTLLDRQAFLVLKPTDVAVFGLLPLLVSYLSRLTGTTPGEGWLGRHWAACYGGTAVVLAGLPLLSDEVLGARDWPRLLSTEGAVGMLGVWSIAAVPVAAMLIAFALAGAWLVRPAGDGWRFRSKVWTWLMTPAVFGAAGAISGGWHVALFFVSGCAARRPGGETPEVYLPVVQVMSGVCLGLAFCTAVVLARRIRAATEEVPA